MKALVNVGCDLYMQAAVHDTAHILVAVGLGFYAQLTPSEAYSPSVLSKR
jgi:prefoldin subunit 5